MDCTLFRFSVPDFPCNELASKGIEFINAYLIVNGSRIVAAGSVIVMLLWVYYSAMILYFGAVFTHVYTVHTGSRIYPNDYAVWIQQIEVESVKSIQQQPEEKAVIKTNDVPPAV